MFLRKNSLFVRKTWTRKTAVRIAVLGLVVGLTSLGRPSEAHGLAGTAMPPRPSIENLSCPASETSPWHLDTHLGAGASTLDFDDFTVAGKLIDFPETYFTATGGPKLGYRRDRRTTHCHPERG